MYSDKPKSLMLQEKAAHAVPALSLPKSNMCDGIIPHFKRILNT